MLARETGWTLEYIEERMDFDEVDEVLTIFDAVDRGRAHVNERAAAKAQRSRRSRR